MSLEEGRAERGPALKQWVVGCHEMRLNPSSCVAAQETGRPSNTLFIRGEEIRGEVTFYLDDEGVGSGFVVTVEFGWLVELDRGRGLSVDLGLQRLHLGV